MCPCASNWFQCGNNRAAKFKKNLIYVHVRLGRGFQESTRILSSKGLSLFSGDHALVGKITFVSNQNHGNRIHILHTKNLFSEIKNIIEGRIGNNGISKNETLSLFH